MTNALMGYIARNYKDDLFPNYYNVDDYLINGYTNVKNQLIREIGSSIIDTIIISKYINLNDIDSFDIYCGDFLLFNIPFFLSIKSINIIDNEYYIKINYKIFSKENPWFRVKNNFELPTANVGAMYTFRLNSNIYTNYKLLINNVIYTLDVHRNFPTNYSIYQYETYILDKSNKLLSSSICNNIYIKVSSPIIEYKLIINGTLFQSSINSNIIIYKNLKKKSNMSNKQKYLKHLLFPNEIINLISEYLGNDKYYYYYSFPIGNCDNSTLNIGHIDNVIIKIKTKDDNYNGYYYLRTLNILNITNRKLSFKFNNDH